MRIDEFEFRNEKGQEIEPTKAQLVVYIKALHKDIKDLEHRLANCIEPKFKRQEIVYSIEYGEINEIEELQVVAYLDNFIILCENRETSKLDWVHKDYLFATEEEAKAKLREIQNGN